MTTLNPSTVWAVPEQSRTIYTHARAAPVGRVLFVSGQFGIAPDGRMHAAFAGQLAQAMANVEALLSAAGMTLADVTKATFILTRTADLPVLGEVRRARWASDTPAAVTVLVVAALAHPDASVEIEVTAVRRPGWFGGTARPGGSALGRLGRIALRVRALLATGSGRGLDRLDRQGDWLLRDLGLDRSEIESVDERRRRSPFP